MRAIALDYSDLMRFISEYKIPYSESDVMFSNLVKKMHKRYYAFLSLHHELINGNNFLPTIPSEVDVIFKSRMNEVLSELGTVFFIAIHGCYKAARLLMRSCIENFSKAIGSLIDINVVNETSVYRVIEIALSHNVFLKQAISEKNFISEKYAILCADVHTASVINMQQIDCIGNFPISNNQQFSLIGELYIKLINVISSVILKIAPDVYHKAHHTHKDLISLLLSMEDKRIIHKIER
ncbi:hypothetical protein EDF81_3721 [Enterobacter sp. BIGb0383]|nr:hypothetical protein EDF81_3721 [Enterobacter sp. BIGb0383]ROS05909.1 hypothetical protein EC848_3860 [Enterobacter sp. BIGb0359]